MKIKLFTKDITDDRFYLMIADSLDAYIEKNESLTEELVLSYAESLREDISNIIDEATEDWINENVTSSNKE